MSRTENKITIDYRKQHMNEGERKLPDKVLSLGHHQCTFCSAGVFGSLPASFLFCIAQDF